MTIRILYLHGLGSSGSSGTALRLEQSLKLAANDDIEMISPNYNPENAYAWRNFVDIAATCDAVVGTSMGGYHALMLANAEIPSNYFVVNPCYNPREMLRKYVGQELPNYTGSDSLSDRFSDYQRRQFVELDFGSFHQPITWFIGKNDDVVDPDDQFVAAEKIGVKVIKTDWGHRAENTDFLAEKILNSPLI
jgi:predicted esterase YcpF (UPF0227 family)